MSESILQNSIEETRQTPQQHKRSLEDIFNTLELDDEESAKYLQAVKVIAMPNMIQCDGAVLDVPVAIDQEGNEIPMTPERAIKRKELNETPSGEVVCAVVIMKGRNGEACVSQMKARQFFYDLLDKCRERGLCMAAEPLRMYNNTTVEEFPKYVLDSMSRFKLHDTANGDGIVKKNLLILVIIERTAPKDSNYGFIKSVCDNNCGVASQVLTSSTVIEATTKSNTIYYNIALKINAKLGGINQAVVFDDDSRSAEAPRNDAVMYVGIHVTYPNGRQNETDISITCLAANIDLAATRYTNKILVRMRHNESVQCSDSQLRQLMLSFHEHSGVWPCHVVILRDGLCDAELIRATSIELNWIRKSLVALTDDGIESKPTITYIVIQKPHLTRFYKPSQDEKGDEMHVDLSSGTVVESLMVSPALFDFYLASQIGTAGMTRPAHYTVVLDEWRLSADKIYEMCYRLCFLSARCRVPISTPCPVYYAQRGCKKAKKVYQSLQSRHVFDRFADEAMRKMEIENRLSVPDHYPGMHFV